MSFPFGMVPFQGRTVHFQGCTSCYHAPNCQLSIRSGNKIICSRPYLPVWHKDRMGGDLFQAFVWYGCFLKWWYPPFHTPKWSFLVGKPMVVGYHHFRKPPYTCQNMPLLLYTYYTWWDRGHHHVWSFVFAKMWSMDFFGGLIVGGWKIDFNQGSLRVYLGFHSYHVNRIS